MALIECRECGNEVSTTATSCPKCGAKVRRYGCGSIVGFAILAIIVFSQLPTHKSSGPAPEPEPSRTVGSDVVLHVSSGDVIVCVDEAAYDELLKLAVAKDYLGIGLLEGAGRVFRVPSGTKARVIDSGFEKREVRIMEGPSFGRSGWVTFTIVQ